MSLLEIVSSLLKSYKSSKKEKGIELAFNKKILLKGGVKKYSSNEYDNFKERTPHSCTLSFNFEEHFVGHTAVTNYLSKICRNDVETMSMSLKCRFQHHYCVYFDKILVLKSTL